MLLVGTELPVADVAFSAGFSSIRQFNDTVREVFGLTPTALRTRGHGAHPGPTGTIDLLLAHRTPIDLDGLFAWFAARAVDGVETAGPAAFARTLRLPGGPAWFEVRHTAGTLRLRARPARLGDLPLLVARVRRLFDLDADPGAVDTALSAHSELAPAVARVPGIRVPGTVDPHEMLIRAMVGQQISVAAARTALSGLARALGEHVPAHEGTELLFPTMSAIAARGAEVLRGPAARIRAVTAVAASLAEGTLELSAGDDPLAQRQSLLARSGIGEWTADYVRMRVTGDPDVFLPGDVAVRAGAAALGLPTAPPELVAWAERAAPWRSYLTAQLWRAAARAPAGRARPRPAHNSARSGSRGLPEPLRGHSD